MSWASLNGNAITWANVNFPQAGIWHADVVCVLPIDVTGPQVLTLGNASWTCAIVRAVDFTGERGVRLVGGLGGWRTTIPAKQYGNGSASALHVFSDAAAACGEPTPVLSASVPQILGLAYLRPNDVASYVLNDVLGDAWWVDSSGVVQTGPRVSVPVASPFNAMNVHGASGMYDIATESPGDWAPGNTFASDVVSGTISRTMYRIRKDTLRLLVMT